MNLYNKIISQKISNLLVNLILFSLALVQISCKPKVENKFITIASKGKIESLDPAQANKLLAIQLISPLGDT